MTSGEHVETVDYVAPAMHLEVFKAGALADHVAGVRLYNYSPGCVALQVRGPLALKRGRQSKDFIVAHAVMTVDQLKALRQAADDAIRRAEAF